MVEKSRVRRQGTTTPHEKPIASLVSPGSEERLSPTSLEAFAADWERQHKSQSYTRALDCMRSLRSGEQDKGLAYLEAKLRSNEPGEAMDSLSKAVEDSFFAAPKVIGIYERNLGTLADLGSGDDAEVRLHAREAISTLYNKGNDGQRAATQRLLTSRIGGADEIITLAYVAQRAIVSGNDDALHHGLRLAESNITSIESVIASFPHSQICALAVHGMFCRGNQRQSEMAYRIMDSNIKNKDTAEMMSDILALTYAEHRFDVPRERKLDALQILGNNYRHLRKGIYGPQTCEGKISALCILAEHGRGDIAQSAASDLERGLDCRENQQFAHQITRYAVDNLDISTPMFTDHWSHRIMSSRFEHVGLEPDATLVALTHSAKPKYLQNAFETILVELANMEKTYPGMIGTIHRGFGTRIFPRLTPWFHRQQQTHINDVDSDWVLIPFARDDPGGELYSSRDMLDNLAGELDDIGVRSRAIESSGKRSYYRRFMRLTTEKKDAEDCLNMGYKPPSIVFVEAHANPEMFFLSRFGEDRQLGIGDMDNARAVEQMRKRLPKEPIFIFDACSVGKEGGIAQRLSKEYDATVICSDQVCVIDGIKIIQRDGRLHPLVRFKNEDSGVLETIVYRKGERVESSEYHLLEET